MKILIVEDDIRLSQTLAEALVAQQYAVDVVRDGESAWEWITAMTYDLILLDITLPKLDGIKLCQRLRNYGLSILVLMLTARDTNLDKIIGLDSGADAYMSKPFNLQELLAQIRALFRRGQASSTSVLKWGELQLNHVTYEVTFKRSPIHLTPKEFALMEALLRSGRRVLSRTAMVDLVWSFEEAPQTDTIKSYIKNIRAKLKKAGAPKDFIETVHGLGYRLKTFD